VISKPEQTPPQQLIAAFHRFRASRATAAFFDLHQDCAAKSAANRAMDLYFVAR
jgi:hypothetical protein